MSYYGRKNYYNKTEDDFLIHEESDNPPRKWNLGYIRVVSIDPAVKNYAIRCTERFPDGKIKSLLVFEKVNLTSNLTTKGHNCSIFNLTRFLNKYRDLWSGVNVVIIERQVKLNRIATAVFNQTISYFTMFLMGSPFTPMIIEVSPKLKGKVLGVPKGTKGKDLKKWAVVTAADILQKKGDIQSLDQINRITKKDDLSDTVCQEEAFFERCPWVMGSITTPKETTQAKVIKIKRVPVCDNS